MSPRYAASNGQALVEHERTMPASKSDCSRTAAALYVSDVDALYGTAVAEGYAPDTSPRDAEWGERFFHITDPDGHELSFARSLRP